MSKKKKEIQRAKRRTVYIVTYNDAHGNGDQKMIEGVLEKRSDFKKWILEHNEERGAVKPTDENEDDDVDALWEDEDEFDVSAVDLYSYKPKTR